MSRRALFFLVAYICRALCSRTGCRGRNVKTSATLKLGKADIKQDTELFDDLHFQEELVIDGEPVNFYFGLMILEYFREKHEQKLIMNIIRTKPRRIFHDCTFAQCVLSFI